LHKNDFNAGGKNEEILVNDVVTKNKTGKEYIMNWKNWLSGLGK
jgi:hypothetical protein